MKILNRKLNIYKCNCRNLKMNTKEALKLASGKYNRFKTRFRKSS